MIAKAHNFNLLLIVIALMLGCQRKSHQWNIPLGKGYALTYYEAAPDDAFFVVNVDQQAVIPPQIETVAVNPRFVWGFVEPKNDPAFDAIDRGLFVLDLSTGEVVTGLDANTFASDFPDLGLDMMRPAASYWRPRRGLYLPHQKARH